MSIVAPANIERAKYPLLTSSPAIGVPKRALQIKLSAVHLNDFSYTTYVKAIEAITIPMAVPTVSFVATSEAHAI